MPGFSSLQGLAQGAGAAQGLAQGLQAYVQTKTALQDQAIKKKLASAQTGDAYAKLLQSGLYPDEADAKARELGIIPYSEGEKPTGFTTPPVQSQQAVQQQQTPPGSSNANAPVAPTIDDSSKSPSASGSFTGGPLNEQQGKAMGLTFTGLRQFNATQAEKNADEQRSRDNILWAAEHDPAKKAAIVNATSEPTTKFHDLIKDDQAKTQAAAKNTKDIFDILDQGGTRSKQAVMELLREIFHPGNPRAGDIPTQFAKGSKAREEIADYIEGKTSGQFSPETAEAIKQMTARLYKNQAQTYRGKVGAVSNAYPGANTSVAAIPEMDVMDKHLAQISKRRGESDAPRGLISPPSNAAPSGSGVDAIEAKLRARGVKF